jgi:hypothetical protein
MPTKSLAVRDGHLNHVALVYDGSNIFQLTRHQQLVGGLLSFWLHLFGTDLPIMIVIYAILMPRYFKLFSPMTAYLLGR